MEISPLFVLLVVWWLFGLFTSGKRRQGQRQDRVPRERSRAPSAPAPRPTRTVGGPDATQREGSRLEQVLREFEQALEEASQPRGPRAPAPELPWEVEEAESLEEETVEVRSLEEEVVRPERAEVALGGDPEELLRRRVAYAETRNRALSAADHQRFDARIREPQVAQVEAAPAGTNRLARLRQAIVWREVLGPPVALRTGLDR